MFPVPMMLAEKILHGTEKMSGAEIASMTIIGLAVVFSGLLILVVFLNISGSFFKKSKQPAAAKPAPAPVKPAAPAPKKAASPAPAKAPASEDDDEVVAVISAVVAAMSAADGKQYKIRSVKPVTRGGGSGRSAWAQAGIHDATRPF